MNCALAFSSSLFAASPEKDPHTIYNTDGGGGEGLFRPYHMLLLLLLCVLCVICILELAFAWLWAPLSSLIRALVCARRTEVARF